MLDDGDNPAGHEAGRAHHLTAAGDLGDLDGSSGDDHVDPATFAGGDDLEAAHLVPGVDQDLDAIALHNVTSVEDCLAGGDEAAVGDQHLAGDEAGRVGGQEQRRPHDL